MNSGKKALTTRKRIVFLAIMVAGPCILIVLALEVAVRIFVPAITPQLEVITPVPPDATPMHSFLRPYYAARLTAAEYTMEMQHNSLGFRDVEFVADKMPDTARIMIIGDSFTYGWGVPAAAAFPSVLKSRLNENGQATFEVYNLGVPDTGTVEAQQTLDIALGYEPDIILLAMLLEDRWATNGNDLVDNARKKAMPGAPKTDRDTGGHIVGAMGSVHHFLAQHSALYAYIMIRNGAAMRRRAIKLRQNTNRAELEAAWKTTDELLAGMIEKTKAAGVPFGIVRCPYFFDVQSDHPDRITTILDDVGKHHSVPVLDLLPGLQQVPAKPLYYQQDGHWTVAGNAAAARLIVPFVLEMTR
jgi:hypothetical protein